MAKADHILTFAQTLRGGGVERAQLRLAHGWLQAGRRVTLVIGTTNGPLGTELPRGLEVIELGTGSYFAMFGLSGHIRRLQPDLIFCPGNHYTVVAGWLRLRLGKACPPIVAKVSNALRRGDHGPLMRRAYAVWLRMHPWFLDRAVAMSDEMQRETVAAMGMAPTRVATIPNPPARRVPGAEPPRMPIGRFLLGVGRLVPQKRWDRLIAAMAELPHDVSLTILGEGAERPALEAAVREHGLDTRVFLPGHTADPLPAFARAAATVLTSDFEGVPGVLREALSQGTPVVATDSSVAIREIVTSPEMGEVVPVGDQPALVAALQRRLAPGATRPYPKPDPGADSAERYLKLFDALVAGR